MMKSIKYRILLNFCVVATVIIAILGVVISWKLSESISYQSRRVATDMTARTYKALSDHHQMLMRSLQEDIRRSAYSLYTHPTVRDKIETGLVTVMEITFKEIALKEGIDFAILFTVDGQLRASFPRELNDLDVEKTFASWELGKRIQELLKDDTTIDSIVDTFSQHDLAELRILGIDHKSTSNAGGISIASAGIMKNDFGEPMGIYLVGKLLTNAHNSLRWLYDMTGSSSVIYFDFSPIAQAGFDNPDDPVFDFSVLQVIPGMLAKVYEADGNQDIVLALAGNTYLTTCSPLKSLDNKKIGVMCVGTPQSQIAEAQQAVVLYGHEAKKSVQAWILGIGVISLGLFAFMSLVIATNIISPLKQLSRFAKSLAKRDFQQEITISSHDEIGELSDSLREVVKSFREITTTSEAIARGDLSHEITPRSKQDVLNHSLKEMIQYIQDVANVAERISNYDLYVEVTPKSGQDILNISLQRMVTNFQTAQRKAEELQEQTEALKVSEHKLQAQQEELRQTNEELEGQARILEQQKQKLEGKNTELDRARQLVEEKAKDLELSSKYKSEFLANMSHELRTPLNSLLILSQFLVENKDGNLTTKQIECINTIYTAGVDLLELINGVLDLAKVEAGKIVMNIEDMSLRGLVNYIEQNFTHVIEQKGLYLKVELADGLPESIRTDRQRVEQITKNFLSNAIKFTEMGGVSVYIKRPAASLDLSLSGLDPQHVIAISVSDTGIGIPEDKQRLIFEAFQQADGTTSRKYGGTGLGLSISRELIKLLGGTIHLHSKEGEGSTFTLYLPEMSWQNGESKEQETKGEEQKTSRKGQTKDKIHKTEQRFPRAPSLPDLSFSSGLDAIRDDRREVLSSTDKFLLIIENEPKFVKILFDLAREKGFKTLVAGDGAAGLQLAYQYKPKAIILDIGLLGVSDWTVLEKLKANPETRHIPVHFISVQETPLDTMKMEVIDYLTKPDATMLHLPIIIYTGKELSKEEEVYLKQYAESIIIKGVKSPERLLDEVTLFLHRVDAGLLEIRQRKLQRLHKKEEVLDGRTVLMVDDDIRNVFALSNVLEEKGMQVLVAGHGKEALELLDTHSKIDLVLMDIMMPEMDGYEAMKKIRKQRRFIKLPIIALTAKAMKGDRQKCLDAGANDYLSKPVETDRLLSLLRVWLY